ncbi:TonB-dependent receptor [uncultured Paraglaciecola sp.]|uniref:TonB-dependent receptor n=1 Tax=uncultured Paraglaciecola sp. TaxID=1765024 RepID=UPI002631A402|nr:TonB-dependent receptor [uncultured Paraglaciecola sp.]
MVNRFILSVLWVVYTFTIQIPPLLAADTSSTITGTITSSKGRLLSEVMIQAIHTPSATIKTSTTNHAGKYSLRGLRVGGPYTLIISSDQYTTKEFHDVFLQIGKNLRLSTSLVQISETETIEIIGDPPQSENHGSYGVFLEKGIEHAALVSRDLKDIVRQNPLAVVDVTGVELSIAGSNPKFNSLTLDGVAINDTFGLNANGYPAQRPPIAMNAINQISMMYAPFSVRASGFTGGTINVVTKSGTNIFLGEIFYEWTPTNGVALDDKLNVTAQGEATKYRFDNNEITAGAAFGGAIVKDRLFYFASYEQWSDEIIFNYDLDSLQGHAVSIEETQQVLTALSDVYGLTDSLGIAPPSDRDKKLLLKLDWTINNAHRADFTYSQQQNNAALNYTNSGARVNFASNQYSQDSKTTLFTTHLFSDWSENFSSEINISYKDHKQAANTASNWAEINIRTARGNILAGQDKHRQGNVKSNQTSTFAFHGWYLKDDIDYKFGVEIQHLENSDLYARSADGRWFFDSIADFENKKPNYVIYSNAYTNNKQDLTATIQSSNYSFYAQIETELFNELMLSAGFRYETSSVSSAPNDNANYMATYGVSNTENLDGLDIVMPRLSVNWQYSPQLTLRGGIGRFSGGTPLVWLSNAYTNDGITKVSATAQAVTSTLANPDNVTFDRVPLSLQDSLIQGDGSTNTIANSFKIPSDWRYQIAADYRFNLPALGDNFVWSTEILYIDRKDAAFWIDQSRFKIGETVEGRTLWGNIYGADNRWDIQLTNSKSGGESTIISSALNKQWNNGLTLNSSYTHQDVTEVNPGNTSTAEAGFFDEVMINRNSPLKGRAFYEIEHRFVLNLGYQHAFFSGYNTYVNLFWERRSGRPFSWTLGRESKSDFGDQRSNTRVYLPYLPASASDPAFDFSLLSYEQIMTIAQDAGVAQYAGDYIPKYVATQPWQTTLDLAITQELPGFFDGHKGSLYFIIDNVANLLNNDWGKAYTISSRQQLLFDVNINENGQYLLAETRAGTNTLHYNQFKVEQSTWSLKVGIKYKF